jgi:hypothetical protein
MPATQVARFDRSTPAAIPPTYEHSIVALSGVKEAANIISEIEQDHQNMDAQHLVIAIRIAISNLEMSVRELEGGTGVS